MLQLLVVVGVVPLPEGLVEVICPLHLRACGVFLLHHAHIVFLEALLILSVCSCWKTTLLSPLSLISMLLQQTLSAFKGLDV